jgi:lipocalin
MGAWIEITIPPQGILQTISVAPYMGAWIEIPKRVVEYCPRGLIEVAPYMGAWIEITCSLSLYVLPRAAR